MPRLVDGREVDSASTEWRIETLCRHMLGRPLAERREWLAGIQAKDPKTWQELCQVLEAVHADRKRHKATRADSGKR
jgi:hypothetical protein